MKNMASINPTNTKSSNETLAELALQTAQGQIGQSEKPAGSNSGPMVNEYLHAAGLKPGYPWCQAFVYWCYDVAAKKLSVPNTAVKTAGVHDCWNRTSAAQKIAKSDALQHPELIKPGDQFILSYGESTGHTGIVESIVTTAGVTTLHTIEGNSNNTGSREGCEVVRHQRTLNDKALLGFIKYA